MKHLDHLGDDGQILGWYFEPQVERLDELCTHLFSWSGGDVCVGLKQGLKRKPKAKWRGSEGSAKYSCLARNKNRECIYSTISSWSVGYPVGAAIGFWVRSVMEWDV